MSGPVLDLQTLFMNPGQGASSPQITASSLIARMTDAIPEVASSRPCLRLVADNDSEELTKSSAK